MYYVLIYQYYRKIFILATDMVYGKYLGLSLSTLPFTKRYVLTNSLHGIHIIFTIWEK